MSNEPLTSLHLSYIRHRARRGDARVRRAARPRRAARTTARVRFVWVVKLREVRFPPPAGRGRRNLLGGVAGV